ncbi:MAG: hypothetical protein ACQETE_16375 [Bacteroidota bacterium]
MKKISVKNLDDVRSIIGQLKQPIVSIYMPTQRKGGQSEGDITHLKNQIGIAHDQLLELGYKSRAADEFLSELKKLLKNHQFWTFRTEGLGLLVTPDEIYQIDLHDEPQIVTYVNDEPYILPLINEANRYQPHFLLALSLNNVRLLRAIGNDIKDFTPKDIPVSLDEYLKFDVEQKHLQGHSTGGGGERTFHGHADISSTKKKNIENFLAQIENEVTSVMRNYEEPLYLCGVDDVISIYKEVNHYDGLETQTLSGSPEKMSNEELAGQVYHFQFAKIEEEINQYRDRYKDLRNTEKSGRQLSDVVKAAVFGKVDTLFVDLANNLTWGKVDKDAHEVHRMDSPGEDAVELFNHAALHTLNNNGRVYAQPRENNPEHLPLAAIYRY